MQTVHGDLARARDAALGCIQAVSNALESVHACAEGRGFLDGALRLEQALSCAEREIVPLLHEFADACPHPNGPMCAGVRVEGVPPSSHALAMDVARKLYGSIAPVRRLPEEAIRGAVVELHRAILSVMEGDNALARLTMAKTIFSAELDSLRSSVWTESTMAEALRSGAPRRKKSAPARARTKPSAAGQKKPGTRKR
jgi:hypothetical protein